MSWFANLVETYDRVIGLAGDEENALLPFNHMRANTDICVILDGEGRFRHASREKRNITIPCTEDSSSRSGKAVFPQPLHEQVGYLTQEGKQEAYLAQLEAWKSRHTKVAAVYAYIAGGTLPDDLQSCEVITEEEGDKLLKLFIRFSVEIPGDPAVNLWEDPSVSEAWVQYCAENAGTQGVLCYATGRIAPFITKHPKGINPATHGAKLLSCNDETNYTYRGRFTEKSQANAVSAQASHKAHAMLKYLIATQGYKCDTQAVVAWAIDDGAAMPSPFSDSLGICGGQEAEAGEMLDTDYAYKLRRALLGMGDAQKLRNRARRVAVIAVDAATTGRMAVTYYQDMRENEYIERIVDWHESCRWRFGYGPKAYLSAPGADRIIAAVYGEPKGEGYAKIKKQARERLLHCILNGERMDAAWVSAALRRASNPFSYENSDGGWDKRKWEQAVSVTCALTRKYYMQQKEEFALELDKNCRDRDYLYGRLLALAERLESHARYKQTRKDDTEKRPTNAVRYMSAFAAKPFRTWATIYAQLLPYRLQLDGGEWFQRQIDEVMSLFEDGCYENDKALGGKYLLGYSLQRRALSKNNTEEETEDAEQEN